MKSQGHTISWTCEARKPGAGVRAALRNCGLQSAGARVRRGARGFTLLELVVAIGVAVLMAVAMAGIFDAVGRTVNGGRRLSDLSVYASLLEQTMRRDFESMSRDGFMVIRNEESWVPGGTAGEWRPKLVKMSAEDRTAGRIRRLDEIMFFSKGQFTTQRDPVDPSRIAGSNSARIYYGHGRRKADTEGPPPSGEDYNDLRQQDPYRAPTLDDPNAGMNGTQPVGSWFGQDPAPGFINPNRYASDWTLVRHVTLLCPPSTSVNSFSTPTFGVASSGATNLAQLSDSPRQIALQPAASSIFLGLASFRPYSDSVGPASFDLPLWSRALEEAGVNQAQRNVFPSFESGLVDIASVSLAEIRNQIEPTTWSVTLTAAGLTSYILPALFRDRNWGLTAPDRSSRALEALQTTNANNGGPVFVVPAATYSDRTLQGSPMVSASQAWMLDAMPAASYSSTYATIPANAPGNLQGNYVFRNVPEAGRTRIRSEEVPPGMFLAMQLPQENDNQRLTKMMALADQQMLLRSGFIPHCSEFVVEWSMGERYAADHPRSRELVWYGLPRRQPTQNNQTLFVPAGGVLQGSDLKPFIDENGDGINDFFGEKVASTKDLYDPNPANLRYAGVYPASDYYTLRPRLAGESVAAYTARVAQERARERLMVHGTHVGVPGISTSESFLDAQLADGTLNAFFGGEFPIADAADGTKQEWPWPRFIRITVSLSDPSDPSYEQQFQMVFSLDGSNES